MPQTGVALLVHASHEAGVKLGGIGAVLDGFLSSPAYNAAVGRTILAGPLDAGNRGEMDRLTARGNRLTILYSSIHGVNQAPPALADALRAIEAGMHVRFVYGKRGFGQAEHEVILVDAQGIAPSVANSYRFYVWDKWGLPSDRYQNIPEYNYYLNAGEPLFAALEALTAGMPAHGSRSIIAHEWLGMPLVFSALLHAPGRYKTVFLAHEVTTARLLVENDTGHDTRFYNALKVGLAQGHSLKDVFGDQSWYYKHAIVERACLCDGIFAVGDLIVDELRFLGRTTSRSYSADFKTANISLVYNGVPAGRLTLEQKQRSRALMQQYVQNLLGYQPDYVFSHVTRMVVSKGLWRDFKVLDHLDRMLAPEAKKAVLFIVSTADPVGHLPSDVYRWEQEYGWPVQHEDGSSGLHDGDLRDQEIEFYEKVVQPFNARSKAVQAVFVNQFGWSRERCGSRMPAEMTFSDLRSGTDLEFGQSIYEPFGISQMEPLAAGALSVVTSVCGCVGFARRAAAGLEFPNLVVADYISLPKYWPVRNPWDALWISQSVRDDIEARNSRVSAQQVFERLPRSPQDMAALLEAGYNVAKGMSWDVVVSGYLLPALARL